MHLRQQHKEELRAQMQANEERHKREHAEYLLEGERTRQKLQAEKDFIEVIMHRLLASESANLCKKGTLLAEKDCVEVQCLCLWSLQLETEKLFAEMSTTYFQLSSYHQVHLYYCT